MSLAALPPSLRRCALIATALLGAVTTTAARSVVDFGARVPAHSTNTHRVHIGLADDYVVVRGDGDTDLDCWIYDASGTLVSSDTDRTDICVLATPGLGRHRLVIRNFGDVFNDYVVTSGSY